MKKQRNSIIVISFILSVAALIGIATGSASFSDWITFQNDNYNTGLTSQPLPTEEPVNGWDKANIDYVDVDTSPIIVNDTLFVLGSGGKLIAYNKVTGVEKWHNSLGGSFPAFQLSTPAYGNGRIFAGTASGDIAAFDAETGSKVWGDIQLDDSSYDQVNTPIVFDEGYIYFGTWSSSSGKYYCYNENGTYMWSYSPRADRGFYWAGAAVVGECIIFGDESGNLTSLDMETGHIVDEIDIFDVLGHTVGNDNIRSSMVYDETTGRIYSSSEAGYCFYIGFNENGTFNVSDIESGYVGWSTSTPAVYNGRVYLGTGAILGASNLKTFYCLDAETLDNVWNITLSGVIQASPVISTAFDDGDGEVYIYFTTNEMNSKLYCMKDFTGNTNATVQWVWDQPSGKNQYTLQGITASDGWLYLGNDAGYVFGLTANPISDFNASVLSGDAPLEVRFFDLSTGADNWSWDFDNDGTEDSTVQNPWSRYVYAGIYNVSLTANNSAGSDIKTKMGYITVSKSHTPDFKANVTIGTAPLTVRFVGNISGMAFEDWDLWEWDINGDGNTDYSPFLHSTHTYSEPGNYSVIAKYANWYSNEKVDYITVLPPVPVANFTCDLTSGISPLNVSFIDQSTGYPDSWSWDFDNDGVVDSIEQNPSFNYNDAGNYTVSLTVNNSMGNDTETKVNYIVVEQPEDWNPWNDPESDGLPDGTYITIDELIEAYACYIEFSPAPGTGANIDIDRVIELYTAYIEGTPM